MAIQVVFCPPPGTTVPTAIADGSNLLPGASVVRNARRCRQAELGGKQMASHAPSTTKKNIPSTTKKFLAAGCLALGLGASACLPVAAPPLPGLGRRTRLGRRPGLGVLAAAPGLGVLASASGLGISPGGPVLAGDLVASVLLAVRVGA